MNKVDYLRENIGALATSTIYSGFWAAVLYDNWPNTYVAGITLANFGIIYHSLKESDKHAKEKYGTETSSRKKDLDTIIETPPPRFELESPD